MNFFEKYRDYSLISRLMAYVLFFDAGKEVLRMLVNMIHNGLGSFSIWTIVCQAVPLTAGYLFLSGRHNDKLLKTGFAGILVLTGLVEPIRAIMNPNRSFMWVFGSLMTLVLFVCFAAYYLGVITPAGRKFYFIAMYSVMGVAALFSIFLKYGISVSFFGMCAVLTLYGYEESRTSNSLLIYAGMIGTAYYIAYTAVAGLLSVFGWWLPEFFGSISILLSMAMPLLVFDRTVSGEGDTPYIDLSAVFR